eukprot:gene14924-biopygen11179
MPAPGAERRLGTSTCTTVRSLTDFAAFSPVLLSAGGGVGASCGVVGGNWGGREQVLLERRWAGRAHE